MPSNRSWFAKNIMPSSPKIKTISDRRTRNGAISRAVSPTVLSSTIKFGRHVFSTLSSRKTRKHRNAEIAPPPNPASDQAQSIVTTEIQTIAQSKLLNGSSK